MRTVARVILSFLFGFVVAYIVVATAAFLYAHLNNVLDRDGGMSMGIVFVLGPFAGTVGGILAAIVIPILLARRDAPRGSATAPSGPPGAHGLPPNIRATIAALTAFVAAYAVTWTTVRLVFGTRFSTYEAALAVSLSPYAAGIAIAAIAAFRVRRRTRREAVSAG